MKNCLITSDEYRQVINSCKDLSYDRVIQVPFSSFHKTFGDYQFDIILIIELYTKNYNIPNWLLDRVKDTQSEIKQTSNE